MVPISCPLTSGGGGGGVIHVAFCDRLMCGLHNKGTPTSLLAVKHLTFEDAASRSTNFKETETAECLVQGSNPINTVVVS